MILQEKNEGAKATVTSGSEKVCWPSASLQYYFTGLQLAYMFIFFCEAALKAKRLSWSIVT